MAQEKTPGVYVVEQNAFPNSVVEVTTAAPAFLGYTEFARHGSTDLRNVPTRITSLADYEALFGGPPTQCWSWTNDTGADAFAPVGQQFLLYLSLRLFFDNGGGTCWIVSVGGYEEDGYGSGDFDMAFEALAKETEPTACVIPDAVALLRDGHKALCETMMRDCATLQSRMAILDIYDGHQPDINAAVNGEEGFRNHIDFGDRPSFGAAYAPWLNTIVTSVSQVDYTALDADSRKRLADAVTGELNIAKDTPQAKIIATLTDADATAQDIRQCHQSLMMLSPLYKGVLAGLLKAINILPPSGAMAGVWARTDNEVGVWKAPANTGVMSVDSPVVAISHEQQEDLNVPLDGFAVNAIRTFMGRGLLVWGARTLDGNSQDWRYINVRRTMIMLEQSIKYAAQAYVFAPNDAGTWVTVRTMIENFLNNQWKGGALAGATPSEAYDVSVGLGSTMTGNDILDGYMRIIVKVALTHPAEFIVITFQQKMQTS